MTSAKLVSVWRALIAVLAGWGLVLHIHGNIDNLSYFTQQSNLLVAVCFAWLAVHPWLGLGPRLSGGTRGAITVYIIVTGVVYATVLDGTYNHLGDLLSHAAVPVLVTLDWLAVRNGPNRLRWWYPLVWLIYPVVYLGFVLLRAHLKHFAPHANKYVYPFLNLDTHSGGQFAVTVVNFIVGFTLLGFALLGIGYGLARLGFGLTTGADGDRKPD